ncbi:MAG: hypothetical protein QW452_03060 [Pyrobaculum sp.]
MKKELAVLVLGSVALLFLLNVNPQEPPQGPPPSNASPLTVVRLE